MKHIKFIKIIVLSLSVMMIAFSCADVEPENNGYASIKINMEDISHQRSVRTQLNQSPMTVSSAQTILAVLMPDVKCEVDTANSGIEYQRALVDVTSFKTQILVPLNTKLKLCLYFFRSSLDMTNLGTGETTPDGFGESGIFTVSSETTAKNLIVEFWATSYSTLNFNLSSTSSAGLPIGKTGSFKLYSSAGKLMDNQTFSITDNVSKTITVGDVTYNTYSYDIELQGYVSMKEAFNVSNAVENIDVSMTPNLINLDWLSFDNLTVTQQGSTSLANASGNLILNVPISQKDEIIQMVSTMQVKRVGGGYVDVTPPVSLSLWTETIGSDNVTYSTPFSTSTVLSLVNGSNELQVTVTISGVSKIQSMGTINYDACLDSNTMCVNLNWGSGLDPDLHSYYFPDWAYQEELSGFDNTSRGSRYWIYSNVANKKYENTGDVIQLKDGNDSSDEEIQVWATDNGTVGNGTYLFYVEDVTEVDVQDFNVVLTGPGLTELGLGDNETYGNYSFKNDNDPNTTEAVNPQAIFFVQVQNNLIKRLDNISIGQELISTLLQWTGTLQNSVVQ